MSFLLNHKIEGCILKDLRELYLIHLPRFARENEGFIKTLREKGLLSDSTLEHSLKAAVLYTARKDYEILTQATMFQQYADHVSRTDCFAYALENGEFSKREIKKIPFDHGETIGSYPRIYGKPNLPSVLREELLNSKPETVKISPRGDLCCTCC